MRRKLLAVFAHPDDESFSSGGTLAKYANRGVEIYLVCATRGEAGQWSGISRKGLKLGQVREKELLAAAEILGVKKVEFLGFVDGKINNRQILKLEEAIVEKMRKIKPQVVICSDTTGISGHLDHIAVSLATTRAFAKVEEAKKLYYVVLPKSWVKRYSLPFPGFPDEMVTTKIKIARFWSKKAAAIKAHQTQRADWERFFKRENYPKVENFYLVQSRISRLKFLENDFFSGLG